MIFEMVINQRSWINNEENKYLCNLRFYLATFGQSYTRLSFLH